MVVSQLVGQLVSLDSYVPLRQSNYKILSDECKAAKCDYGCIGVRWLDWNSDGIQ
jgi:hypothetical protein